MLKQSVEGLKFSLGHFSDFSARMLPYQLKINKYFIRYLVTK
jgi:hypothetical protein